MKKTAPKPKRKPAGKWRGFTLTLKPSERVFNILSDFREKYMRKTANQADAANILLITSLMDYEHTMARLLQVETYCKAEGFADQGEYRESILRAKFPRGRVPRPKVAR